jgi:thioredoxin reductase
MTIEPSMIETAYTVVAEFEEDEDVVVVGEGEGAVDEGMIELQVENRAR